MAKPTTMESTPATITQTEQTFSLGPSPVTVRLQARRMSLFDRPKPQGLNITTTNNEVQNSGKPIGRRSSFQERAPTPVPPFVAPDVEVPKEMLRQQLKKYSFLPTNASTEERPPTPIPSEEVLKSKKQVFHMLNQNMKDLYEEREWERQHSKLDLLKPQEHHTKILQQFSRQQQNLIANNSLSVVRLRRHSAPRLDMNSRNLVDLNYAPKK
jgi:hypothetical protein